MADMARELVECDRCTLWLVDRDKKELWSRVAHSVDTLKMPMTKGVVGEVLRSGKLLCVNNVKGSPFFNPEVDKKTGYQTRTLLAVPIFDTQNEIMGVYQAINKNVPEGFSQEDAELLTMSSIFSGKSLETALLYNKTLELYDEVEKTQKELVYILGEAGEIRSRETGNHVKRVGEFCFILAQELKLPAEECELIRLAAPLHDIGKVSIPDAVLNKPGKLDPAEYEIMKLHASIGGELLTKSPRRILKAAADIAAYHHERWDGKGYPHGIAKEEIPLFARICSVADVYDALSNDRCYKKGWPAAHVEEFLKNESGLRFDPKVIDAFFRRKEDLRRVSLQLAD